MNSTQAQSERGAALLIAMLLVFVIGTLTSSLASTTARAANDGQVARGLSEARAAAEGGIETARIRLASTPGFRGEELVVGRCTVGITVAAAQDGSRSILATASCPVRGAGLPVKATIRASMTTQDGKVAVTAWSER